MIRKFLGGDEKPHPSGKEIAPAGETHLARQLPNIDLLYISDKAPGDLSTADVSITITITEEGVESSSNTDDPSTIYTRLPVKKPSGSVEDPGYFPSYARLTPEQRWKYLTWLFDITAPINIGYVYVYYYGLERQLLVGNFDKAFAEILRLKKHHAGGSFDSYSNSALLHSCVYRKRIEKLEEVSGLVSEMSNSVLLASCQLKLDLSSMQVLQIFNRMPGLNRKYLREHEPSVIAALPAVLKKVYGLEGLPLHSLIQVESIQKARYALFANTSLPGEIRTPNLPDFFHDPSFVSLIKDLYKSACKESRAKAKKSTE